ncbi:MAG: hypothetical protein K8S25_06470 [Alphaproteobacteria bacterium]|nr:hypothetical protein [Alphaproteobacteria bacterium]
MLIDGSPFSIGEISLHFQYFLDDGPPHAWLDIHSDSENERLAGVAINCLNIGDIPRVSGIYGRTFTFGQTDETEGAELSESVFWRPGQNTLELSTVHLRFGAPQGELLPIEIVATCSDHKGTQGIAVTITGEAVVASKSHEA